MRLFRCGTDPVRHQFASALRSRRGLADVHAHRSHDHHAVEEFRFLQSRFPELRAADTEARHGSLWPPTELAEGYYYELVRENYVLSGNTRNLNLYYLNPLQHAEGMLMAWLPKERLLMEADVVDTNAPLPAMPTRDQTSLFNAVKLLKLDPLQIVPVHGKPIPWTDFTKIMAGRTN